MAEAMTNAAQIQLGIGQNQLSVFKQISDSARAVMDGAAQSIRDASNIWEGTVKSAQGYKQQQIDAYFKGEQLKLDDKRIKNEALYRRDMLSKQSYALEIQELGLNINKARFDIEQQKIQESNTIKPYIAQLNRAAGQLNTDAKIELDSITGRETVIRDRLKNMSTAERLLSGDELNAELSTLSQRRDVANRKAAEAANYINESLAVSQGAPPSLTIPGFDNKTISPQSSSELPSGGGLGSDIFFPSVNQEDLQESDGYRREIGIEEGYSEGHLPDENYPSTIPLNSDDESKGNEESTIEAPQRKTIPRDKLIGALFSIPADKVAAEAPGVLALADADTKAYIQSEVKGLETDFLLNYAESIGYSTRNKPDDALGIIKDSMIDIKRLGGDETRIGFLQREANRAIRNIKTSLMDARSKNINLYPLEDGKPGETFDLLVSQAYNKWVSDRGREIQQSEDVKRQQDKKSGIVADGTIDPEVANNAFSETPLNVENYTYKPVSNNMSGFLGIMETESKAMVDETNKFLDEYTFKDGENKGKIKSSFIKFVEKNIEVIEPGLLQIDISSEQNRRFYEQAKADAINKAVKSIGNHNKAVAFELWKKAGGLKNK